jgi:uncharacterized protein (DUF2141 family)
MNFKHNNTKYLLAALMLLLLIFSCANIGNPNGGPYDEDPPKYVSSKPAINQLNFKGKVIEVLFDEFINIDNPSENVIVTPPQKQNPIVQALGKKVRIELKDTLKENTAYTIDFTSSISDNNEKNVLENYSFAFSTGDILDTMQISGRLLDAENLEPVGKIVIGIHSDLSDTAFTKTPFLRASKSDEQGRFVIHNITPGEYHVFGVEDKNRNYAYDKNGDESLAFLDSIISPYAKREMVPDTIWKDTITVDTVKMVEKTIFYPNDLILWLFKDSIAPRQRMLRPDRPQEYIITLRFNAPLDTFPKPEPLNFEPLNDDWYIVQKGDDKESFSLNYWILDSMIYKIDTMEVAVSYWKNNDSIPEQIDLKTDTLRLVNKEAAQKKKKPVRPPRVKKGEKSTSDTIIAVPPVPLQVSISPAGSLNPEDVITIKFNEPVLTVKKEFFKMELGVDTLWNDTDFVLEEDTTVAMTYYIKIPFNYNQRYRLLIDSAVLCGVYGHYNNKVSVDFTVKTEKDYGHLLVSIEGLPLEGDSLPTTVPAFVELLNNSGSIVRKAIVKDKVATFMNMTPEKYYARIIIDANGNGKWDAGNYAEKRQPETIKYFMKQFEIIQNWKIEETWDISKSKLGEKPEELIKNKPKEKMSKKRDYREESKPRSSNSSSPSMRGMPF